MNLLSWLLFGIIVGIMALASESRRSTFTVVAIGINSIIFGIILAITIISKGVDGINLFPFLIAGGSILAFISLQRVLKQI